MLTISPAEGGIKYKIYPGFDDFLYLLFYTCIQFSPVITPHARSFVHHVIIYQCTSPIRESIVGESVPCDQSSEDIANCRARGGFLVAVWAVGGEVSFLSHECECHTAD